MKPFLKKANDHLARHSFSIGVFASIVIFVMACGGLVVANGETIRPDDSHIVNVSIDGKEQTIPTRAQTVGELISKLTLSMNPEDVIEPDVSTVIDTDNFRINIYRATPTTIIDGDKVTTVLSAHYDAATAVKAAGINIYPEDIVERQYVDNILSSRIIGRKLVVDRANTVTVNVYGSSVEKRTHIDTVQGLLTDMNIQPAPDDTVTPALTTPITNGTAVFVTKYGKQVANVEEPIAFATESTEDASMSTGSRQVIQAGVVGRKIVTYEIDLQNGIEVARRVIQETIVAQPTLQKVIIGTKPLFADYNADGIPNRVFCGSSKQGNWKNINVGNAAVGRSLAAERGWTGSEFNALLELFACESSWNERAGNPYSGAYGIPQSLPASKMASFGEDYLTNPVTQIRWGLNYIASRYGSPSAALAFHYRTNWY